MSLLQSIHARRQTGEDDARRPSSSRRAGSRSPRARTGSSSVVPTGSLGSIAESFRNPNDADQDARERLAQRRARLPTSKVLPMDGRRVSSMASELGLDDSPSDESEGSAAFDDAERAAASLRKKTRLNRAKKFVLRLPVAIAAVWVSTVVAACAVLLFMSSLNSATRQSSERALYSQSIAEKAQVALEAQIAITERAVDTTATILHCASSQTMANVSLALNYFYKTLYYFNASKSLEANFGSLILTTADGKLFGIDTFKNKSRSLLNASYEYFFTYDLVPDSPVIQFASPVSPRTNQLSRTTGLSALVPKAQDSSETGKWSALAPWKNSFAFGYSAAIFSSRGTFSGAVTGFLPIFNIDDRIRTQKQLLGLSGVEIVGITGQGSILGGTLDQKAALPCPGESCSVRDIPSVGNLSTSDYYSEINSIVTSDIPMESPPPHSFRIGNSGYDVFWNAHDNPSTVGEVIWFSFLPVLSATSSSSSNSGGQTGLLISLALIFGTILVCIPVLRKVSGPLHSMSIHIFEFYSIAEAATTKTSMNNKGASTNRKAISGITELRALELLFYRVRQSIAAYVKFLPTRMSARVVRGDTEAIQLSLERKNVGVIYIEIFQFHQMLDNLSFDRISCLLRIFFDNCFEVAKTSGAVVGDFTESSICLFFEDSGNAEETASATVECGLAMRKRFESIQGVLMSEKLPALEIHMGLHFGSAFIGNYGKRSQIKPGVIGGAVNTAKTIRSLCSCLGAEAICTEPLVKALVTKEYKHRPLIKINYGRQPAPVGLYDLKGSVSPPEAKMIDEYEAIFNAFYNTKADWSVPESISKLETMCATFMNKYPFDWSVQHIKKKIFARELAKPTHISKVKN